MFYRIMRVKLESRDELTQVTTPLSYNKVEENQITGQILLLDDIVIGKKDGSSDTSKEVQLCLKH